MAAFSASVPAGRGEQKRSRVTEFDTAVYYALLAVDQDGNVADLSNVVKVKHRDGGESLGPEEKN